MNGNTWMQRCLGVATIAGGLWLAGTAAASADTGSTADDASSSSSLSAPLEIGGVSFGVDRADSSSASESSTVTDEDGTSTSERTSDSSSADSYGVDLGAITADPAAMLEQARSSESRTAGDAGSSADSSSTDGSASAPVTVEGLTVTVVQERDEAATSASSTSDEDGTSSSSESTSDSSTTGGTFGIGELTADPMGAFANRSDSSGFSAGDASTSDSSSDSSVSGALPITFEGVQGAFVDQRESTRESGSTVTDEDGTSATSERSTESSSNAFGFEGLGGTFDPTAGLTRSDERSSAQAGDDVTRSESASSTSGDLAGPFTFDGLTGWGTSQNASTRESGSTVTDENGTTTTREASGDESSTSFAGRLGEASGDPRAWFADERSDSSATAGDADRSDSASRQWFGYAFPFEVGESGLAGEQAGSSWTERSSAVTDEDGTVRETERTDDSSATSPELVLDGLTGSPSGGYDSRDESRSTLL